MYFGAWNVNTKSSLKNKLYVTYQVIMGYVALGGIISLIADFVEVFGDFKAMSFNLCFTALFTSTFVKMWHFLHCSSIMDSLRKNLYNETKIRSRTEDKKIDELAWKQMKTLYTMFYVVVITCVPTALYLLYFRSPKGPNTFTLPLKFPIEFDYKDISQFNIAYFFGATLAILGFIVVIEHEVSMFTLLIQISREYTILIENIPQLNQLCEGTLLHTSEKEEDRICWEINPGLKKLKAKKIVKKLCSRLQRINE